MIMDSDLTRLALWLFGREKAKSCAEIAAHLGIGKAQAAVWIQKLARLRGWKLHKIFGRVPTYYTKTTESGEK